MPKRFTNLLLMASQTAAISVGFGLYSSALADNPVRQSTGLKLYNAGKFQEAAKWLGSYEELEPEDASAHYYRGNTLVKLGRFDEASEEYKKVIGLNSDAKLVDYSVEAFNAISAKKQEAIAKKAGYKVIKAPSKPLIAAQTTRSVSAKLKGKGTSQDAAMLPPPPAMAKAVQTSFDSTSSIAGQASDPLANSRLSMLQPPNLPLPMTYSRGFSSGGDLLPPSISASGAKVSPTVGPDPSSVESSRHNRQFGQPYTPQSYSNANNFGGGYNNYNNNSFQNYGRHRHHHGNRNSYPQSQSYGQSYSYNNHPNYSSVHAPMQITEWNEFSNHAPSDPTAQMRASVRSASAQTEELKRVYANEAERQIDQVMREGGRHNYDQQKRIQAIRQQFDKKIEALEDAATHFDSRYADARPDDKVKLSPTHNDLHIQNYEITDTPNGDEVPLMATPLKLSDQTKVVASAKKSSK